MGILGFIVLGLIVGAIVKAVLPGRVGGGWPNNLVLGVLGAILGGLHCSASAWARFLTCGHGCWPSSEDSSSLSCTAR